MARLGQVASDDQAFQKVLERLENEVGTMLGLIDTGKLEKGLFPGAAPFWSLVRMTFPIAESIGDLVYRHDSTVQNLRLVLEHDFEAVRTGYADKSAALALLYRHSLTHQDEMRSLQTGGRELGWQLSYRYGADHLRVTNHGPTLWSLHFDTTTFYEDMVAVCRALIGRTWNGAVMDRYNSWLTYDLDAVQPQNQGVRAAITFIRGL
jgi:hypothetical protein